MASWSLRTIQEAIYGKHSTNEVANSSFWSSGNQVAAANGPDIARAAAMNALENKNGQAKAWPSDPAWLRDNRYFEAVGIGSGLSEFEFR